MRGDQMARTCKHFTGVGNDLCKKGHAYDLIRPRVLDVCLRKTGAEHCADHELPTPEEVAADIAETDAILKAIDDGISPCCQAPLDESQVITSGRFKDHGPRFCSKCKQTVFVV
jgi:hypothetical protein